MTLLARGQVAWLRAAGRPTVREDAPDAPPVRVALLTRRAASLQFEAMTYAGQQDVLVLQRGALGALEHGTVVLHDGVRVTVQADPMPVPPDTGLVMVPCLVET